MTQTPASGPFAPLTVPLMTLFGTCVEVPDRHDDNPATIPSISNALLYARLSLMNCMLPPSCARRLRTAHDSSHQFAAFITELWQHARHASIASICLLSAERSAVACEHCAMQSLESF